jgi:tRNA (guanine-N7-)-methyltransferase
VSLASSPLGPGPEVPGAPAILYELTSILEPLEWDRLFPVARPVEVELGCGDGSFLLGAARGQPDHNYLGIERLLGRIRKVDRKGRKLGLDNLRAVRIEAAYCLEYLLPAASVHALHVYFPDPWPKPKHQRHRLVQPGFPGLGRRVLLPAGRVYLRTDDAAYFAQMREVFGADPGYREVSTPAALAEVTTDFEREFLAAGRSIHRTAYERFG